MQANAEIEGGAVEIEERDGGEKNGSRKKGKKGLVPGKKWGADRQKVGKSEKHVEKKFNPEKEIGN